MVWPIFAALFGWIFAWIINKTIYLTLNPSRKMYWSWIIGAFVVSIVPILVLTGLIYKSQNASILFAPFVIAFYSFLKKPSKKIGENLASSIIATELKVVSVYPVNSPKVVPLSVVTQASIFNQSAPPSQPIQANFAASAATTSATSDDLWAQALAEYDSGSRNQGLWARLFSEAQGNETMVKANYMRIRVDEMQQVIAIEKERVESAQKVAAAKEAELLEAMSAELCAYDALPKGICPNCKKSLLPLSAIKCTKCSAIFGEHSVFKITELSKQEQINQLRLVSLGGNKLTEYETELLKREQ